MARKLGPCLMARTLGLCLRWVIASAVLAGCASGGGGGGGGGGGQSASSPQPQPDVNGGHRPQLYPLTQPPGFRHAVQQGSRTETGEPGPRYWQQWTDYRLTARLFPEQRRLEGTADIVYHNRSPNELPVLHLHLNLNLHAEGAPRKLPQEVTGGVEIGSVSVNGAKLGTGLADGPRYEVDFTRMTLHPPQPLAPGDSITISMDWSLTIPQTGADARMGWDADNFFFIAYWYPQMAVYDDVVGWQIDRFRGGSEFYAGFGSYDLTLQAPVGWVIVASGRLQNPEDVLAPHIIERLRRAEESDAVVHVITSDDFGERGTAPGDHGWLTWRFQADELRDVAFSATAQSLWDAVRTPVGDRDGDGSADFTRVDAIYRELAPRWEQVTRYGQHAIDFLSRYTGLSYPWPHMTAVEGSNIINGGMEFPMMTLIGDYNERGDSALYYVTAHELAHMWVPMVVATDERRYSWMDEGTTSFNENQARKDFFPGFNHDIPDQNIYIARAVAETEGEIMRRSDFQYPGGAFGVASYQKPASVLVALRGVLGEAVFMRAYRTYLKRWAYKHPYPWDMFNTFSSVSGRDLDWFWRAWYYETWWLDQAIVRVSETGEGIRIVIADLGLAPMPIHLVITRANGDVVRRDVPVDSWLAGATQVSVMLPAGSPVVRVEIDPDYAFPDVDRDNNVWPR